MNVPSVPACDDQTCAGFGGECRGSGVGQVCLLLASPCDPLAESICSANAVHQCQDGFALATGQEFCQAFEQCYEASYTRTGGEHASFAYCGVDPAPCDGNAAGECRGNVAVTCSRGFPGAEQLCDGKQPNARKYNLRMEDVKLELIRPRLLAAVRRTAAPREIPKVFKPALDLVWAFLRKHPGLRTDGHNVFLYHHVERPDGGMPVDFGVEVTRRFEPEGEVRCVETPAGEASVLVHRGPYSGLPQAHAALHQWCATNGRRIGAYSLEIYGDWSDDRTKLETTIQYLLR